MASELLERSLDTDGCRVNVTSGDQDRRVIARGGLFTMAGSIYAGAAGFALTLLVGKLYGAAGAGAFFEAVAIFTILNGIAVLGSDTGLLRMVASRRSLHAHADVGAAIRATAWPVLAWSALIGAVLWMVSGAVASELLPRDAALLEGYLRVVAVTLLFSAFGQAALVCSRGYDDLRPYLLAYQIGLSTARIAAIAVLGIADESATWLVAAWAVPLVLMDLFLIGYVIRRHRVEQAECTDARPAQPRQALFREVWKFNVPRGLASFFETCIVWSDVLIVGWFLGPVMAGAYAAASRFITTGTMAMEAMRVAAAPTIAASYAQGQRSRANDAYQLSSIWLVLLSWPVFLTLAAFSPFVLGLIGEDFQVAATAMSVMSLGILGYLLLGNINTVLLMAGRSSITATNTFVTLILNVGLNLILVPRFGLVGAAISWALALVLDSTLCVIRGRRDTGAVPPVRGLAAAALACLASFGITGLVVHAIGDQSLGWFVAHLLVSGVLFVALVRALAPALRLGDSALLSRLPNLILRSPR